MSLSGLFVQALNGLAAASTLFLLASGLSLIFGVTRIVNFAHGSFYMLGAYVAWSLTDRLQGAIGFWFSIIAGAAAIGVIGMIVELTIMRRIYRAPELFQLLATFALTLVIKDATLALWGAEDLLGPRAPGLAGAITILDRRVPQYDLALIASGPLVLLALQLLLTRTRWGVLVRAATQDRQMVAALGVNQAVLFTSVFALGAALAGLGGALQLPREPAGLSMDMTAIGDAFVVVVVGGMGSIPGAFVAALLIAEVKALCIALGDWQTPLGFIVAFPKFTLVAEFAVMAIVLILRPWGLMGRPDTTIRPQGSTSSLLTQPGTRQSWFIAGFALLLFAAPLLVEARSYTLVFGIDVLTAVLFAASLHFLMGPGGMHSFGHAAYFGLGAYAAALCAKALNWPMWAALVAAPAGGLIGAILFGWFCVRLSGVYLAMLTLAFSQIVWSVVYQWDGLTGGSNGIVGVWPSSWYSSKAAFYCLAVIVCGGATLLLRRILFAPFGYAMRAARDSVARSEAIGLDVRRIQWIAFSIAGAFAGLAGGLFAFSKGSISPETLGVSRSIDGLVMVLLGGVDTISGPIVGAAVFLFLQDQIARHVEYWRAILGLFILALVLLFPAGIVGTIRAWTLRR
ncbi:MAG: ABC transporter permease [Methylobacteriaceae bacterium]|nr:ABC transporter permease [Methylobacteriaceae bacterium]